MFVCSRCVFVFVWFVWLLWFALLFCFCALLVFCVFPLLVACYLFVCFGVVVVVVFVVMCLLFAFVFVFVCCVCVFVAISNRHIAPNSQHTNICHIITIHSCMYTTCRRHPLCVVMYSASYTTMVRSRAGALARVVRLRAHGGSSYGTGWYLGFGRQIHYSTGTFANVPAE